MMILYNTGIFFFGIALRIASLFNPKARLWRSGRRGIFDKLGRTIDPADRIVWVHAASLGEFEQGRPFIEEVRKQHPEYKILLTFFSPSGYEIRKNYQGADYVFYLPLDTARNARRFIAAVRPEIAVFVKYEFWLNYLRRLGESDCRTFIISAIFRRDSVFFRWYGGIFRRGLRTFERMFVQNDESRELLQTIGIDNVEVTGDTRFDRVVSIARSAKELPAVGRMAGGSFTLVCGSTWPADEEIIADCMGKFPEVKFIVAPHEIDRPRLEKLAGRFPGETLFYTETDQSADLSRCKILIVDTIGVLSSIYRYGSAAYIGGGFGVGIHNILEAATFGLPVAFGPNYQKFREARDLVSLAAARPVDGAGQLSQWLTDITSDDALYEKMRHTAADYTERNSGATDRIIAAIFRGRSNGVDYKNL